MNTRWLSALALAGLLVGAGPVLAQAEKKSTKEIASFGTLRSPTVEAAHGQALDWLKDAGKTDDASLKAFAVIWDQPDRMLMDRVADTFALGDADARKLLADAHDVNAPAPLAVPELLKDAKRPLYFRTNLASRLRQGAVHSPGL